MILISACLLGVNCKYNGGNNLTSELIKLLEAEGLVPVCPEQLGGLGTPRVPAEIQGGDGKTVIEGIARVLNREKEDITEAFVKGAEETLKLAKLFDIKKAVLKARSPSCGCGIIYDGSFSAKTKTGDGVTTTLLKKNGIEVLTEESFK